MALVEFSAAHSWMHMHNHEMLSRNNKSWERTLITHPANVHTARACSFAVEGINCYVCLLR
jgi:hypothetical protein